MKSAPPDPELLARVRTGRTLTPADVPTAEALPPGAHLKIVDPSGALAAVVEMRADECGATREFAALIEEVVEARRGRPVGIEHPRRQQRVEVGAVHEARAQEEQQREVFHGARSVGSRCCAATGISRTGFDRAGRVWHPTRAPI